jgi:2-polyprenyl-3-methyl-5-hydroxy-6-metoxy-1,4-benzoquinol methylase
MHAEREEPVVLKTLNINHDPLTQGFEAAEMGSYDVLIINNVLHITDSLEQVVMNARKLLKAGGALLLVGMTDLSPAYRLIFGAVEGMWSGMCSYFCP